MMMIKVKLLAQHTTLTIFDPTTRLVKVVIPTGKLADTVYHHIPAMKIYNAEAS